MAELLTFEDVQTVPLSPSKDSTSFEDIPQLNVDGLPTVGISASIPPDTYKALKQYEDPIELLPSDMRDVGQKILTLQSNPDKMSTKIKVATYFAEKFQLSFKDADRFSTEIARQKWDIPNMSPQQIFERIKQTEDSLLRNQIGESFDAAPFSTFGKAFKQSLAGKPALALRGAQVFTPEKLSAVDVLLQKTSDIFEGFRDAEDKQEIEIKAAGKLWPINEGDAWWKISPKLLPETINAWAANLGDQIPLIIYTQLGRIAGKKAGKLVGVPLAAAAAIVTGGPDPSDAATIPLVVFASEKIGKHIGGATPLIAIEAGSFMDYADSLGIDKDIAEKYARQYAPISGLVEYSQQIFRLNAFAGLTKKAQSLAVLTVLKRLGFASLAEGLEELTQEALQNKLIGKAIDDMKSRNPDFQATKPRTFEGGGRAFAIGTGTSLFTAGMGQSTRMVVSALTSAATKEIEDSATKLVEGPAQQLITVETDKLVAEAEKVETAKGVSEEVVAKIEEIARPTEAKVELTEAEAAKRLGTSLEQIQFNNDLREKLTKNNIIITDDIRFAFKPKPVKGPGLTKAEQKILTPEQQRRARFAQTQKEKFGFRQAEKQSREEARRVSTKIKEAKKLTAQLQQQAVLLTKEFLKDNPDVRKDFLSRIPKVETIEDLQKFQQEIDAGIERAEQKSAVKELEAVIKTIKPDKMLPQFGEPARKILDSIQVSKRTTGKTIKINDLLDFARQTLEAVDPDSITAVEAETIIADLESQKGKTVAIRLLDVITLQQITDSLLSLQSLNLQENSIITSEKGELVSDRQDKLVADVRANPRPINEDETTFQKIGRNVKNFLAVGHGNLESISDNMNKGRAGIIDIWQKNAKNLTQFTYDVINQGSDIRAIQATKARDLYRSILERHNIITKNVIDWAKDKNVFILEDGNGKTKEFSFTTNELLSIFMHTRNTHNLDVLRQNGIDRFLKDRKIEIRGFTNDIIDSMIGELTQSQKAFAREIGSRLMDGINKDALNETSQKLESRNIATIINYWPARRAIIRGLKGKRLVGVRNLLENMGFLRERVGTGNPLRMSGFFETVYNVNKNVAAYAGMAPALRDVKSVLSNDVIAEYQRNGWKKEIDSIVKIIERVEDNPSETGPLDTVLARLIGGFARSRFALNVKIWIRQQLSSLLMTAYIAPKHLAAMRGVQNKEIIDRIKRISPQTKARFESFRFDRDIGDATLNNELQEYLTGELTTKDTFLLGMKFFDTNAIVDVFRVAESEIAELRPELKQGSTEFESAVKQRFEWLVRHTQPMWNPKDRSLIGSDPRPLFRALTMFMSQREQMVRMVTSAQVEYSNSAKDNQATRRLAKVYGAVGMNIALFTMYNTAWALVVQRKKKTVLDVLGEFIRNIFGNLFYSEFSTEIIRATVNGAQGKFNKVSFETGPQSVLSNGVTGIVTFNLAALHFITGERNKTTGKKKWKTEILVAVDSLADSISGVTGLPYVGPKDIIKGLIAYGNEFETEPKATESFRK